MTRHSRGKAFSKAPDGAAVHRTGKGSRGQIQENSSVSYRRVPTKDPKPEQKPIPPTVPKYTPPKRTVLEWIEDNWKWLLAGLLALLLLLGTLLLITRDKEVGASENYNQEFLDIYNNLLIENEVALRTPDMFDKVYESENDLYLWKKPFFSQFYGIYGERTENLPTFVVNGDTLQVDHMEIFYSKERGFMVNCFVYHSLDNTNMSVSDRTLAECNKDENRVKNGRFVKTEILFVGREFLQISYPSKDAFYKKDYAWTTPLGISGKSRSMLEKEEKEVRDKLHKTIEELIKYGNNEQDTN